ncbi:MAG: preprotein translocase subunit SecE [Planctomycetota bacterium]|jgi:preprotein translocase SecE subunit
MSIAPYKWPQGRVIRYLAAAVCLSYISFGTYCFWAWKSDAALPFVPRGQFSETFSLGLVGSALLALAGAIAVYFLVFTNAKVTDYLISVEGEMRKVYWPKIKPWFAWSSELWGSTYVVIIVVVVLSVFIRVIDLVFTPLSNLIFN